jgi:hypothetical protein
MSEENFDKVLYNQVKNSLTPEQIEDYKKFGEYMYNNVDYKNTVLSGSQIRESKESDLLFYACEALKSGIDPHDLTEPELQALNSVYGVKWYERFNLQEYEVPKLKTSIVGPQEVLKEAEKKLKKLKLPPRQKKLIEKNLKKEQTRMDKNKK